MPEGAAPSNPPVARSRWSNLPGAAAGRLGTTRARLVVGGIVVVAILVTVAGLSRGNGPTTPTPGPDGPSGSAATMAADISNTPILYFATSADTTTYFHNPAIKIDSSAQKVIRFLPEKNVADLVDQNASYSFAESEIYPYTVDRRLFIRREVDPYGSLGSTDIYEYDPRTGQKLREIQVGKPNSITQGCAAIVGDSYVYQVSTTRDEMAIDPWAPMVGGEFMKMDLSNSTVGTVTELLGASEPGGCQGHLAGDDGQLFDAAYFDVDSVKHLEIYKRDLTTGRIIDTATKDWAVDHAADYGDAYFAFDNGLAYWAEVRTSDGEVEIYSNDFVSPNWSTVYAGVLPGIKGIDFFASSNGYLAVGNQSGAVFLFDTHSGKGTSINLGLSIYAMQILYIRS
jgi:hypothetical protein